jgi:hypothetical protein
MVDVKWLIGLVLVAVAVPSALPAEGDDEASARRVEELAGRYEFYADAGRKSKCERHPKPLLSYTNPVEGQVYGNVFVWTYQGRPEVIGALFDHRSQGTCYSELHTLARPGIIACRDGKEFWKPAAAGVQFRAVPGAPAPAATSKGRLLQMGELARGFSVEREHPAHGKEAMRMMARPVFRYDSAATDTLDGAAFVFVDATTDPEAFLLLEASGTGRPTWQYAFARMNLVVMRARYRDDVVWQVERVEWATVYDRHEPYAIVHEKSRRGLAREP